MPFSKLTDCESQLYHYPKKLAPIPFSHVIELICRKYFISEVGFVQSVLCTSFQNFSKLTHLEESYQKSCKCWCKQTAWACKIRCVAKIPVADFHIIGFWRQLAVCVHRSKVLDVTRSVDNFVFKNIGCFVGVAFHPDVTSTSWNTTFSTIVLHFQHR